MFIIHIMDAMDAWLQGIRWILYLLSTHYIHRLYMHLRVMLYENDTDINVSLLRFYHRPYEGPRRILASLARDHSR